MSVILWTPAAEAALGAVEQLTAAHRSTVVNDAVTAYAALVDLGTHEGAYRVELEVAGRPLYVLACRTKPEPKRWWLPW